MSLYGPDGVWIIRVCGCTCGSGEGVEVEGRGKDGVFIDVVRGDKVGESVDGPAISSYEGNSPPLLRPLELEVTVPWLGSRGG